jgi:hypothetical protein
MQSIAVSRGVIRSGVTPEGPMSKVKDSTTRLYGQAGQSRASALGPIAFAQPQQVKP